MTAGAATGWVPASFAQLDVWLNEQRRHPVSPYHMPFTLTFDGDLDTAALTAAVQRVLSENPILTSVFDERDGVPHIRAGPRAPGLEVVDPDPGPPSGEPAKTALSALSAELERRIRRPFGLRRGPLIRLSLHRLGERSHVLLVVVHHLIFDGESMELFVRQLAAAYRAVADGEPGQPAAAYAPAAHVADEGRRLATDLPAARRFWRERWRRPEEMALPGLRKPVPEVAAGECVELVLDGGFRTSLGQAADATGVSVFEFLLASLYGLLYRYGNGTPTVTVALGLRPKDAPRVIGMFAHELPLTLRVAAGTRFVDLARLVRQEMRELRAVRGVPLSRAVTGVRPTELHTPVSLGYRPHDRTVDFPGLNTSVRWLFNHAARGALWIQVLDSGDDLRIVVRYPPAVLAQATAERVGGHWRSLLAGVVAAPDEPVGALAMLDPAEREQLLAWNSTGVDRPTETVAEMFAAQVASAPDRVAAVSGKRRVTYGRLATESGFLARRLGCVGAGPASTVAVLAEPSLDSLIALLAVLRAGAACLPLDASDPPDRLAAIVAEAGAAAVIGDRWLLEELPTGPVPTVAIDDREHTCARCDTDGPGCRVEPSSVAYLLTTSARGRPWGGVEVDHRALVNLVRAIADVTGSGPDDTWLAWSPPWAETSAVELLLPLVTGSRVVIAEMADRDDGGILVELIRRHRVNRMQASPAVWHRLLAAGIDEPSMRGLIGGDRLTPALARRLAARVDRLWSVYGHAEATIWSTCCEVPPDVAEVTIGRPLPNTTAYVLGEGGEPMPIGSAGRLHLGGHGVTRPRNPAGHPPGRFIDDPFGPSGSRLFRTGDRARYRADGELEFLGAVDDRVVLGGRPVELGRIEVRLAAHPDIVCCAVTAEPDPEGETEVVAYLTAAFGTWPTADELGVWMAEALPGDSLPAHYVRVDRPPLTDVGRLDRAALREARLTAREEEPGDGQGGDAVDERLTTEVAAIWRNVLRVPAVRPDDNLFDFSVTSLTIAQISARIRQRLKVDVPLEVFYDVPTAAGVAAIVAELRQDES